MKKGLIVFIILFLSRLCATNVSGHIAHNTTWSPENNPYIVTGFLYVDSGVTLTLEPGVEVKVVDTTNENLNYNFTWHGTIEPSGKMIIVNGSIIAIGTESQPITFDHNSGDSNRRWGGIFISATAPPCSFRYCHVSHQYKCQAVPGIWSYGSIHPENGIIDIRNCRFHDCYEGIETFHLAQPALVYNCIFEGDSLLPGSDPPVGIFLNAVTENYQDALIARCTFTGNVGGTYIGDRINFTFLYNYHSNPFRNTQKVTAPRTDKIRHPYGIENSYGNYGAGFACRAPAISDTAYCRRNTVVFNDPDLVINQAGLVGVGEGTVFLSDNNCYGNSRINLESPEDLLNGYFYNNIFTTYADFAIGGQLAVTSLVRDNIYIFNNLFIAIDSNNYAMLGIHDSGWLSFNTFYNFSRFLHYNADMYDISNNIVWNTRYMSYSGSIGLEYPTFSYNCLSFPITFPVLDGGNNFTANPLFADTLNANFHLQTGSPCIDAGSITSDLPDFDADYNLRVVGSAPDLGAYEYGSVYIGGIQGYAYDTQTNQSLDCVKISISGKLPEFTDTIGLFTAPVGIGLYTVKASRWDYQDVIIPNVPVNYGENTMHMIPMQSTTANEDNTIPLSESKITLYNYPNPFKSNTNISFILPDKGMCSLDIYNIKGQKVKTLATGIREKGLNIILWDGKDNLGKQISNGIYFCRLTNGNRNYTIKIVKIR